MNTIYYSGKLKRGKTLEDLYNKLSKGIKKKGVTKLWELTLDGNELYLDFKDEESDVFCMECDKKGQFNGCFKVAFEPSENEELGAFETFFDLLYKAKSFFSKIEFSDDYELAKNYWESKKYKIVLRELTDKEFLRWKTLYDEGITNYEDMLRSIMADDLGMSFDEFYNYVNYDIALGDEKNPPIFWSLETYLFESASFRGERLCEISELQYYDLGSIAFSTYAFVEGISWIFLDGSGYGNEFDLQRKKAFTQKDAQVGLFFREIFIPLYLQEETDFEKTVLAYRYFLSVYDYLGFKFEGRAKNLKLVMDRVLEEYGQEKGKILLTYYCTYLRYIEGRNDENAKVYAENWNRHFKKCFGDKGALVYRNMLQKYRAHWRFIHETEYVSSRKLQYIDDRLVL